MYNVIEYFPKLLRTPFVSPNGLVTSLSNQYLERKSILWIVVGFHISFLMIWFLVYYKLKVRICIQWFTQWPFCKFKIFGVKSDNLITLRRESFRNTLNLFYEIPFLKHLLLCNGFTINNYSNKVSQETCTLHSLPKGWYPVWTVKKGDGKSSEVSW